jgi:hypothetical protein
MATKQLSLLDTSELAFVTSGKVAALNCFAERRGN